MPLVVPVAPAYQAFIDGTANDPMVEQQLRALGEYSMVYSYGGYTNEPARLLVPHLYFWKSAKWVAGIRILDYQEPYAPERIRTERFGPTR